MPRKSKNEKPSYGIYRVKIEPCPWCKKEAKAYLEGSYSEGWTSFVSCSNISECDARGPVKTTCGGLKGGNDEYVVETHAIEAWNTVAGEIK